ncbi:MIP/aquaporin family protein [Nocardia sp. NPDC051833]|uniref:MIP/aquaporin family protein n=1 Tax=Nocardia sp. NPDC051833 TaxID=3155674 RepID=UPI003449D035
MTDIRRRLLAEFVGTAALVTVVVGSGIAAQQLTDDVAVQLLANSTATVFGLGVLILVFGPVSGAHFNPVVSLADWLLGRRHGTGLDFIDALAYAIAQIGGAVGGAVLANIMFDLDAWQISTHDRITTGHLVGEVVATAGLIAVIFALARSGRAALSAAAVAAYIGAAYWFTSSTSFANPAVTIGRVFSDTFAGIAPMSAPGFIVAQFVGAALGLALIVVLYPGSPPSTSPPRERTPRVDQAQRAVRLRPQRRTIPDGTRLPDPPRR